MAWGTRNLVSTQGGTTARGSRAATAGTSGAAAFFGVSAATRASRQTDDTGSRLYRRLRRRRWRHAVDDDGRCRRAQVEAPGAGCPAAAAAAASRGGSRSSGLGALGSGDVVLLAAVGIFASFGLGVRLLGLLLQARRRTTDP